MRNALRSFFESHVHPNYQEWLAEPLDERKAKNAVADANNMAERVWHYWKDRDLNQVYGARNPSEYRDELSARECPDFGLVRDVADAHKHFHLNRPSRQVTRSDQTGLGRPKWGKARWNEWAWGDQLVVTLDDQTERPLGAIMKNVTSMWERLLRGWAL